MFSRLAQALESLLGPSLLPWASTLSRAATVGLLATVVIALARALFAMAARKYGWERGWIVRCPSCAALVADASQATCPRGHTLRFPPGAARASRRRQRRARLSALSTILLSVLAAVAALAVYLWLGVGNGVNPVSRLTAAIAYFFFLAALYAADFALSPRPRGIGARLLHVTLAIACLTPFLLLAIFSRSAAPPAEKQIQGAIWATPSGVYLSNGRSRKIGPPAPMAQAHLVDARVASLDLDWHGLTGVSVGSSRASWHGVNGWLARRLDGWGQRLAAHGVRVRQSTVDVPLPVNVRVRIFESSSGFDFEPETP